MHLGGVSLLPHCVCGVHPYCVYSQPVFLCTVVRYSYQDSWEWVPEQLSLWDYWKYNFEVLLVPPFGDLVCKVPLGYGF